jgi:hypothetical protein
MKVRSIFLAAILLSSVFLLQGCSSRNSSQGTNPYSGNQSAESENSPSKEDKKPVEPSVEPDYDALLEDSEAADIAACMAFKELDSKFTSFAVLGKDLEGVIATRYNSPLEDLKILTHFEDFKTAIANYQPGENYPDDRTAELMLEFLATTKACTEIGVPISG